MIRSQIVWLWLGLLAVAIAAVVATVQGVLSRQHQNDALETIICTLEQHEMESKQVTAKQKVQVRVFWNHELRVAKLHACTLKVPSVRG